MEERPEVLERRFKILLVNDDILLTILRGIFDQFPDAICLPVISNLPKDIIIVRVNYIWEKLAFGFLIAHRSFSKLELGCQPLFINSIFENRVVRILKEEEKI